MIDFQFQDPPKMSEVNGISVQCEMPYSKNTWVEMNNEVLVKFHCRDGIFYITLRREKSENK